LEDDGEPESVLDRIRRVVVPKGAPDRRGIVVDRQVREVLVLTGPGGGIVTHRLLDLDRLGLLFLRGGLGFFLWRGFGLLRLLRLGSNRGGRGQRGGFEIAGRAQARGGEHEGEYHEGEQDRKSTRLNSSHVSI